MAILLASRFGAHDLAVWRDALQGVLPEETLLTEPVAGRAHEIDIALAANPPAGALRGLPALRLVQSLWAGVEGLLADRSLPADVPLARMVDPAMNAAMAETAAWAVLSLHRGFFDYAAQQREARWQTHRQRRADEVCVGVLGLGEMGRTVALRLVRDGYRVMGWSTRAAPVAGVHTGAGEAALNALLSAAEIVINLLPLTPATRGFFDARRLAQLRPGAALVNLARGAHVVDEALLAALDAGQIGHAVLDAFEHEPLPAAHPYWSHPKVTLLPHVAAQTDPRSAAQVVAGNVRALRAGRPLAHLVDRSRGY
ncbi:MAG TPA: glyoxylate/hydroxypyruvate reductase A [Albitalea sp.]|nr:glyoxylate/hydroxypyruvate reductase A [Albitalea sp.]